MSVNRKPANGWPAAANLNALSSIGSSAGALLRAFGDASVAYLIVGDHAVRYHGYERPARALELWLEPTAVNLKQVALALANLGTPLTPAESFHLAKLHAKLRLPGRGVELLTSLHGLMEFAVVRVRADRADVGGQGCPVLCLPDLYRTKRGTGRAQDEEDLGILSAGGAFDDRHAPDALHNQSD
ncbi:hypothetical protein [Cupriavidus necator]